MKKYIFLLTAFIFLITGNLYAQLSTRIVVNKVLNEGILYPEPKGGFVFFEDFFDISLKMLNPVWLDSVNTLFGEVLVTEGWQDTVVSAGTGTTTPTVEDLMGGILKYVNAANEDDGFNLVWSSEIIKPKPGVRTTFKARARISEPIQSDFFAGFTQVSDTLCKNMFSNNSGAYFYKPDADSILYFVNCEGTTADTSLSGLSHVESSYPDSGVFSDSSWVLFEVEIVDTSAVYFSVNNHRKAAHITATSIPVTELSFGIGFLNGSAAVRTSWFDYIIVEQRATSDSARAGPVF